MKSRRPHDADLEWYFTCSAADMGYCSSFGPMVAAAQGGFGGRREPEARITDRRIEAAARERHIRERLHRIAPAHRWALWTVYGLEWPPQVKHALGELAGIAVRTAAAESCFRATVHKLESENEEQARANATAKKPKALKAVPGTLQQWILWACVGDPASLDLVAMEAWSQFVQAKEAWDATTTRKVETRERNAVPARVNGELLVGGPRVHGVVIRERVPAADED